MSKIMCGVVFGIANGDCHIFLCPSARVSDHVDDPPATRAPHHGVAEGGRVGGVTAEHAANLSSWWLGEQALLKAAKRDALDARPCVSPWSGFLTPKARRSRDCSLSGRTCNALQVWPGESLADVQGGPKDATPGKKLDL